MKELQSIQGKLKAPKSQRNSYGKYNYRSCEDILEAVKPLLTEYNSHLVISDEMVLVGDRIYCKATATITNSTGDKIEATGYARESESKKGMDSSQLTGATSSYARKYALNGLLAIDDTKDSDVTNDHGKAKPANKIVSAKSNKGKALLAIRKANDKAELDRISSKLKSMSLDSDDEIKSAVAEQAKQIGGAQ